MNSQQIEQLFEPDANDGPAAKMYLEAFRRLATDTPLNLGKGTVVSQNNVAKEAGKDPSALKLNRYPGVIRKIQTYLELTNVDEVKNRARKAKIQKGKLDLKSQVSTLTTQLSASQSKLLSVERRLIEALQEIGDLKRELDGISPSPTELRP